MPQGLVLIDKEQGWTSHDAVAKLRGILGTRKIGHAGTLDPMATGLLVLGVNAGTKLLQFLVGAPKQYIATIRLGMTTVTDDADGETLEVIDASAITADQVLAGIQKLTGDILQTPSSVSAIKVDGKRAYDLVREGKDVELKSRAVKVSRFELVAEPRAVDEFLDLDVLVDCSSGTYIRALARDLGGDLGVGGHLTALKRTKVGNYSVDQASKISGEISVLDLTQAAQLLYPEHRLSEQDEIDLRHGKRIPSGDPEMVVAINPAGNLVAVLEKSGRDYKSVSVFPEVSNA
ncbi:MAG: tRNA pseudouridine(55) synthase TruB [Aquiluna sp.]|nr:tRNA pseudouridine(55) synthase TruB [Aquiluna sp.]MCF8546035.1 tRNA pseudouridine(55) synthase TruB [Aquiluna sp.]